MPAKKQKKSARPKAGSDVETVPDGPDPVPADVEPIEWRWKITLSSLLLLSVLILFLSWIKFFDLMHVDRYLQDLLISYVGSTVSKDFDGRVALILVDKEQQPNQPFGNPDAKHRPYHAN